MSDVLSSETIQIEWPSVLDFPKVCRVCLSRLNLHSIFNYHNHIGPQDLSAIIGKCSKIVALPGDGLPDKICEKCIDILQIAHLFKTLSESSDKKLKEALKNGKVSSNSDQIGTLGLNTKRELKTECCDVKAECCDIKTECCDVKTESCDVKIELPMLDECEGRLSESSTMDLHHECLLCDSKFSDRDGLISHAADRHGTHEEYRCHGCDLGFDSKKLRRNHEKKSCPKMPPGTNYKCRKCPLAFSSRQELERHGRAHAGGTCSSVELGALHACPHCPKTFTVKHNLYSHIKLHQPASPISCEVCNKVIRSKKALRNHMQIHSERVFACSACPYRTNLSNSLTLHLRSHSGERPYACEWCTHRSVNMSNLLKHQLIHTGVKKFECLQCGKKYKAKRSLTSHMNSSHLGIRPFCCHKCGKAYAWRDHLRVHLKRAHPEAEAEGKT